MPTEGDGVGTQLIITDVAYMSSGVCLAGYRLGDLACIRPVLGSGGGWPHALLEDSRRQRVTPFSIVELDLGDPSPQPPHIEDYLVGRRELVVVRTLSSEDRWLLLEHTCNQTVRDIFGPQIGERRWVLPGAARRSLGTIRVDRVEYVVLDYDERYARQQYRISFIDGEGLRYNLPVTDLAFRQLCDAYITRYDGDSRVAAMHVRDQVNRGRDIFVRLGLSRPFLPSEIDSDQKCYLLVTGIYGFPAE